MNLCVTWNLSGNKILRKVLNFSSNDLFIWLSSEHLTDWLWMSFSKLCRFPDYLQFFRICHHEVFDTHLVYSFNLNQLSHKNTLQGCQVHCLERNHRDLQLLFHERIFPNSCVTLVGLERRLWNNRYIVNAKYDWCCFIDGSSKSPVSAVFSRFCKNHHQSFVRWHL